MEFLQREIQNRKIVGRFYVGDKNGNEHFWIELCDPHDDFLSLQIGEEKKFTSQTVLQRVR